MASESYQKGRIEQKQRRRGAVFVLRYRIRDGMKWTEKTERLIACKTVKEANKIAAERMVEINLLNSRGHHAPPTTFAEFVGGLWQNYRTSKNIKPSTAYNYDRWTDRYMLPAFGEKLLREITPADITGFFGAREKEGWTGSFKLTLYSLLKVMFEVALDYGLIHSSPVKRKLHRPSVQRREKPILTVEEIRRVVEAIREEQRPLFLCLALTGLRIGELLALRWKSIDFEKNRLTVTHTLWRKQLLSPKTEASKRILHMPASLAGVLKTQHHRSAFMEPGDFVFAALDGSPLSADNLRRCILYHALEAARVERGRSTHGFHLFRHSAASIVHACTRDIALAQELLGHTRLSTTADIYTHTRTAAEQATETLAREIP